MTKTCQFDFEGKKALVTGSSRGIGRSIARTLLERGATVFITSTSKTSPAWAASYKHVRHFQLNLTCRLSVDNFISNLSNIDPLDILINNAGVHEPEHLLRLTDRVWRKIFLTNLDGPMQLMRAVGDRMKNRSGGHIVNVASIAGTVCKPNAAAYSASKLALIGLTRAAAIDLAPHGILVNSVSPGTTHTNMVDKLLNQEQINSLVTRIPLGRLANPDEIANAILFLVSNLNTYITGQNLIIDGGTSIS